MSNPTESPPTVTTEQIVHDLQLLTNGIEHGLFVVDRYNLHRYGDTLVTVVSWHGATQKEIVHSVNAFLDKGASGDSTGFNARFANAVADKIWGGDLPNA